MHYIIRREGVQARAAHLVRVRRVLAVEIQTLGATHRSTLASSQNLARTLVAQGKQGEASAVARAALAGMQRAFGREHPETAALAAFVDERGL